MSELSFLKLHRKLLTSYTSHKNFTSKNTIERFLQAPEVSVFKLCGQQTLSHFNTHNFYIKTPNRACDNILEPQQQDVQSLKISYKNSKYTTRYPSTKTQHSKTNYEEGRRRPDALPPFQGPHQPMPKPHGHLLSIGYPYFIHL